MKIKMMLAAALCSSVIGVNTASAAETLLATETLQLEQGEATAELWGDRMANGYANDLLVLLKDKDKKLLTAYAPSIKGGYNCLLYVVKPKDEKRSQLFVSAGQGDWRAPSEYRVLSFKNKKEVSEVFGAADNLGIVTSAKIKDGRLELKLANGTAESVLLDAGLEVKDGAVTYGGLHSLTPWDVDRDEADELLGSQRLMQGKTPLADIGAVWKRDKEGKQWEIIGTTIMTLSPVSKGNTVNDGCEVKTGTILPRRIVVRGGEATYPVFAGKDAELQNKINRELWLANYDYMLRFYAGNADTAFKVMHAGEHLLSIQLICGKKSFVHKHVNLDPTTGEVIKLSDILNVRDKDLIPLLNVLCTNEKIHFTKLPDEWYIEGENLFLLPEVQGREEIAGFNLGNLHKFILDKEILQ